MSGFLFISKDSLQQPTFFFHPRPHRGLRSPLDIVVPKTIRCKSEGKTQSYFLRMLLELFLSCCEVHQSDSDILKLKFWPEGIYR